MSLDDFTARIGETEMTMKYVKYGKLMDLWERGEEKVERETLIGCTLGWKALKSVMPNANQNSFRKYSNSSTK